MTTKYLITCISALCGILLLAVPAAAQDVDRDTRSDEHLESLIERLEIGMSALEELGRRDALDVMRRIASELREERAHLRRQHSREKNDEIRTVRRRLKVMRTAVNAFIKAERRDAAELVERAMHARELAIEGRRDEEARRIRENAPSRGELAEALGDASNLYEKWDMPEYARALAELSDTYAKHWRRQLTAKREEPLSEREREPESRLDSLATRVEIIRYARDAFAEAGDRKNVKVLNGVIHYGELALERASDEQLSKAVKAVPSKGDLVEYMNCAARKYDEWGRGERAGACRRLAEYYARQLEPERGEGEEEPESKRNVEGNIEDLNHRIEILGFAHHALAEAGWETGAGTMKRFIHVAKLQQEGADQETLARAFEGLSMGQTIELLQKASGFYAEWGWEGRAAACNRLAEYYAARERGAR
jgi:hypothetical protein